MAVAHLSSEWVADDDLAVGDLKDGDVMVNEQTKLDDRECKASDLKNGGLTLAVIKFGLFVDHYVTVLEVTDSEIIVGDPFRGKMSYSHQEFRSKWRFVGVVLKRKPPTNSPSAR